MIRRTIFAALAGTTAAVLPEGPSAQGLETALTNTYGTPSSLIDMPTAEMAPDGQISATVSHAASTTRTTLSFQIAPRLSGSFRYTAIDGLVVPAYTQAVYYDRSFDLSYRLLNETDTRPAVAIGLRDFVGTGLYSSEYTVATKGFMDRRLRVSGGIGWGRLGSVDSFASIGSRPTTVLGQGGIPTYDRWFRGPVAAFGGVSFAATDRLTLKLEYSSDDYAREARDGLISHETPFNVGIEYRATDAIGVSAYALNGSEFGAMVRLAVNPRGDGVAGGTETAPVPVAVRPAASAADLGWTSSLERRAEIRSATATALAREGLVLEGLSLDGRRAQIRMRNPRYDVEAQAFGRAARVLTRTLPASVDTVTIAQTEDGIPVGAVTLNRADLERLENAPASAILDRSAFSSGLETRDPSATLAGVYPRYSLSVGPYLKTSYFDPASPVRADVGIRVRGSVLFAPGWSANASVTNRLFGNVSKSTRVNFRPPNAPPIVRTDFPLYNRSDTPQIERLTVQKIGRLGPDLYGRATAGYLESMYAGLSGEVLWKPVESRFGLGAEVNYVSKRDYDQLFGLRDYRVATGHLSAYYDFGGGFHGQVDVGRYLAGDWGATIALDREFENGWSVGAYATKTDVSSSAFGEGSFDKGIRVTVPLSWALNQPDKRAYSTTISPLTRDGGARLNVQGRLYDKVRETHGSDMRDSWGRFWR